MNEQDKLLLTLEELSNAKKGHTAVIEAQPTVYPQDWAVAKAQLAKAQKGEQRIRELLWATHPCEGKYWDDGELQCGRFLPPIDFKRDSWETIAQGIEKHTEQRIKESLKKR